MILPPRVRRVPVQKQEIALVPPREPMSPFRCGFSPATDRRPLPRDGICHHEFMVNPFMNSIVLNEFIRKPFFGAANGFLRLLEGQPLRLLLIDAIQRISLNHDNFPEKG